MVVAAVALDEAGPFAVLGEARLEVGLEGEEGGEGVGDGVFEWLGGMGLCGRHWVCLIGYSVTLLSCGAWRCDVDALIDKEMPRLFSPVAARLEHIKTFSNLNFQKSDAIAFNPLLQQPFYIFRQLPTMTAASKRQKREDYRKIHKQEGNAELPKKKFYRQRAHANPFSDHQLT